MGLDIEYQAIPDDCSLLSRARHDAKFGSYLESFKSYATASQYRINNYAKNEILLDFISQAKQLVQDYPGIENRIFDGGRRWDMLHYLLSEKRRRGKARDDSDWATRAILGGNVLNLQTQTTIGSSIRYLAPTEVRYIADRLNKVSSDELRQHWNVKAMIEAAVYKIHPSDDEASFEGIETVYKELSNFYVFVAQYKEGILTCLS